MSPFKVARTLGHCVLAGWHWLSRGLARTFASTTGSLGVPVAKVHAPNGIDESASTHPVPRRTVSLG